MASAIDLSNINDRAVRDALHARLKFLRELGIYEIYRREIDPALWAEVAGQEAKALSAQAQTLSPPASAGPSRLIAPSAPTSQHEENDIAPRKPFPASPVQPAAIPPTQHFAALKLIREEIGDCTRCVLSQGRTNIVFGDGDPNAKLMFVGEGPGADEDASGLPFVGRGGQLLNNMINAMGLMREQVYIANVVKCRPPANRTPEPDEAHTCSPFLFQQIDVIRPSVIVALGQTAVTYLTGEKRPLSGWRGSVHALRGSKLIVTYHPAYLLRDPNQKRAAWQDLQIAMRELGLKPVPKG